VRGGEEACRAVLERLLAGDDRFVHREGEGWLLREPGVEPVEVPPAHWPWAVWAIEPKLRAIAIVRLERGAVSGERIETAPLRRPAVHDGPSPAGLQRLASLARDACCASAEPGARQRRLRDRLMIEGRGSTAPFVPLGRLALAALGPPRPRSLAALAARLALRVVGEEDPLARARLASECLLRMLEAPRLARCRTIVEILETAPLPSPGAPLPPPVVGAGFPDHLPHAPGIYRFDARDGELLYVGRSRNLKRRVGSYFLSRALPDPRTRAWLGRVFRVEIEETGSEARAMILEAEAIARDRPAANRAREVHERPHRDARDMVVLVPSRARGRIEAHLLRAGAVVGRVALGPRGGGAKRLLALLQEHYFNRSGGGDERDPERASPGARRSAALLSSWLAARKGPPPAFVPTDSPGPEEARAVAMRYAASLRRGESDVVYRA
jgi:hypothetical protein